MLRMRQLRAVLCIALLVCSCMQLANARQLKQASPAPGGAASPSPATGAGIIPPDAEPDAALDQIPAGQEELLPEEEYEYEDEPLEPSPAGAAPGASPSPSPKPSPLPVTGGPGPLPIPTATPSPLGASPSPGLSPSPSPSPKPGVILGGPGPLPLSTATGPLGASPSPSPSPSPKPGVLETGPVPLIPTAAGASPSPSPSPSPKPGSILGVLPPLPVTTTVGALGASPSPSPSPSPKPGGILGTLPPLPGAIMSGASPSPAPNATGTEAGPRPVGILPPVGADVEEYDEEDYIPPEEDLPGDEMDPMPTTNTPSTTTNATTTTPPLPGGGAITTLPGMAMNGTSLPPLPSTLGPKPAAGNGSSSTNEAGPVSGSTTTSGTQQTVGTLSEFEQCGGAGGGCYSHGSDGSACVDAIWPGKGCQAGYECVRQNFFYRQCLKPDVIKSLGSAWITNTPVPRADCPKGFVGFQQQCGGSGGACAESRLGGDCKDAAAPSVCCEPGTTCQRVNEWFWQCQGQPTNSAASN